MATPTARDVGSGRGPALGYSCVLLVERDEVGKQALERALLKEGLQMLWARSSAEAELLVSARRPALILLDPRLAPEDGWLVYRRLLRFGVPIMVLAGSAPAVQKVALQLGAAECLHIATPAQDIAAHARQLLAQVPQPASEPLTFAGLRLDSDAGVAHGRTGEARLTRTECALLHALMEARGRVVSREQLVERARAAVGPLPLARAVDAHIRALRAKLGDDPRRPRLIEAVRGFGYRLAEADRPKADSLAGMAFSVLPTASLVVDERGSVQVMNERAKDLLGACEGRTCAELLGCAADVPAESCPGRRAAATGAAQRLERQVCLRNTAATFEEIAVPLPARPGYFVLELRQASDD